MTKVNAPGTGCVRIQQPERAGITWYGDGQPVFELVKELVDGETPEAGDACHDWEPVLLSHGAFGLAADASRVRPAMASRHVRRVLRAVGLATRSAGVCDVDRGHGQVAR